MVLAEEYLQQALVDQFHGFKPRNPSYSLRAYARRLVKEGITVNSVAPSIIETDMLPAGQDFSKRIPVGRMGRTDEVAEAVVFASGNAYMTGQTIPLNGGLHFR